MGHLWGATHFRSVLARHHRRGYARTGFQTAWGYRVGREGSPVRPNGEAGLGDGYRVGGIPQDRRTPGRFGDETPPRGWFPKRTSTRAGEHGGDPQSHPPRTAPTAPPDRAGRGVDRRTSSGRPRASRTEPSAAPASRPRQPTEGRTTGTRATSSADRRSGSGGCVASGFETLGPSLRGSQRSPSERNGSQHSSMHGFGGAQQVGVPQRGGARSTLSSGASAPSGWA